MQLISKPALIGAIDAHFGSDGAPRRIGVAVSGGSDSLGLLTLLLEWGRADGIAAATVDHGLRAGSAAEAAEVAAFCAARGIPHDTLVWGGWDGRGNLQDQARRARYALLADWARDAKLDTVAIGHTMNDDAETFLMRVGRQAGLDGLSGMAPVFWRHDMRFDRPLLGVQRGDIQSALEAQHIPWTDDPSNVDDAFLRVKARRAMDALAPLGISAQDISGVMGNLNNARRALDEHIQTVATRVVKDIQGDLVFDKSGLRQQTPEVTRKLLSSALRWVSGEEYPPRRAALAELEAAIFNGRGATLHGCGIAVTDMTIRIYREASSVAHVSSATDRLWDGRWRLEGPHDASLEVRALGDAIVETPWRETNMPRRSLLTAPAVWRGDDLVAAPIAGLESGWRAYATGRGTFTAFLLSR